MKRLLTLSKRLKGRFFYLGRNNLSYKARKKGRGPDAAH
jgi:hypothetical protein